MRHRHRPKSTAHDRELKPPGRNPAGPKSARPGYPALFLGHAAATKTLVEIACRQPVSVEDLPERDLVSAANLGYTVRRLVAVGLVRRYRMATHQDRYLLALNPEAPWAHELQALLRVVGRGQAWPHIPTAPLPQSQQVVEGANVTGLRIFGRPPGDIETIFGTPNRTLAIIFVAALRWADASTIARQIGVEIDGDMLRLLDPIEADGVFRSEMVGQIRLYSLADEPWAAPLRRLVDAILAREKALASQVAAAAVMVQSGNVSSRVHLRAHLRRLIHRLTTI